MDRWKSRVRKKLRHGESQKGEDERWRRSESVKVRRENMQVREKGRKDAQNCVVTMICALEGRKVGSLKWRVRS